MVAVPRVLLVSYYYPPAGGPGVQRALKMSRYLPDSGWDVTVLTVRPESAAYPALDPSLLDDVPTAVTVARTDAWDPYAAYARLRGASAADVVSVGFGGTDGSWKEALARWVRANVFLPDARVGWVPFAAREGRRLLREVPHDAILTTGPPHSAHLTGRLLSRATGLPHVVDLRDPWVEIDYRGELPQTAAAAAFDAGLEKAVLRRAAAATVVTPAMKRAFERRIPRAYDVILNGFDPADFAAGDSASGDSASGEVDRGSFVLHYAGNVNGARSPEALWAALARLDAARTMPELRVRFVGKIDDVVRARADAAGVGGAVEVLPYVPHAEAVAGLRRAALLLLLINRVDGAEGIMTGKLFEYLASGRPVVGLGPVAGDAADALRDARAGEMFDWDDAAGLARHLRRHYDAWAAGRPLTGAPPDRLGPYSRVEQARQMAAVLTRVASSAQPGSDVPSGSWGRR